MDIPYKHRTKIIYFKSDLLMFTVGTKYILLEHVYGFMGQKWVVKYQFIFKMISRGFFFNFK